MFRLEWFLKLLMFLLGLNFCLLGVNLFVWVWWRLCLCGLCWIVGICGFVSGVWVVYGRILVKFVFCEFSLPRDGFSGILLYLLFNLFSACSV